MRMCLDESLYTQLSLGSGWVVMGTGYDVGFEVEKALGGLSPEQDARRMQWSVLARFASEFFSMKKLPPT